MSDGILSISVHVAADTYMRATTDASGHVYLHIGVHHGANITLTDWRGSGGLDLTGLGRLHTELGRVLDEAEAVVR